MRKFLGVLSVSFITLVVPLVLSARTTPELRVDSWVHLPEGMAEGPTLHKDWANKVVYLYFFQSWCPGCHSSGFPTLQAMLKEFGDHPEVRIAAVQTVFEGFQTNTVEAAEKIVERYKLQAIPVGQSGTTHSESKVMRDFHTRGTPWTVIIGPDGEIAYTEFHISPAEGSILIKKLLDSPRVTK